jgi:transcriptional regulator NrdR family protein
MIACPICGAKTRVVETRVTGTSTRRRRRCWVTSCTGKVTTVERVVRDDKGSAMSERRTAKLRARQIATLRKSVDAIADVPARQIAKLRKISAAIVEAIADVPDRQVAKLAKLVASIEGGAL